VLQNKFPVDSLSHFPSFYHGEKMWKISLSELVHDEAVVQGGFRLVFLRKNERKDKMILQCTIGCARYKVYGGNPEKVAKRRGVTPKLRLNDEAKGD
jgi:hypothetical protein